MRTIVNFFTHLHLAAGFSWSSSRGLENLIDVILLSEIYVDAGSTTQMARRQTADGVSGGMTIDLGLYALWSAVPYTYRSVTANVETLFDSILDTWM